MVRLFDLPKITPDEIVSELREKAREEIRDLNAHRPGAWSALGLGPFSIEDHVCWIAADLIEEISRREGSARRSTDSS